MTKKGYIELIEQALSRQNWNNDQNVIQGYISVYMSAMLNYLIVKQYYLDLKTDGSRDISGLFYAVYENVPLEFNSSRNAYSLTLPQKVIALPNEKGIPYIGSMQDDNQFIPLGQSNMFAAKNWLPFTKSVYFQIEGQKVWFKNISLALAQLLETTGVLVKMVVDIYEIGMNDEVPVPAGMETEFINGVVDFFLGKKRIEQDTVINNKEG